MVGIMIHHNYVVNHYDGSVSKHQTWIAAWREACKRLRPWHQKSDCFLSTKQGPTRELCTVGDSCQEYTDAESVITNSTT